METSQDSQALPRARSRKNSGVKIRIGEKEHIVDVKKIPYFESFLSFQAHSGQDTSPVPTHDDIPLFEVVNYGVSNGFRQYFRRLPTQLSEYHTLCETLEFLAIDVLAGRSLRDIMHDMRQGKDDWDPEERSKIDGAKSSARDSAFRLVYAILLGEFTSEVADSNMAYNAVVFVVSHRRIFKYRTRKVAREAFEERFCVSEKQRKGLDNWPVSRSSEESGEEAMTTEMEDFDSDSSWWS